MVRRMRLPMPLWGGGRVSLGLETWEVGLWACGRVG